MGDGQYNVLRRFTEKLIHGFSTQGVNVDVFDLADRAKCISLAKGQYDMIFALNGMTLEYGSQIFHDNNTIFWSFLLDHPYYHHYRLLCGKRNYLVSCVDHHHVDYIKHYYSNVDQCVFMPHGGMRLTNKDKPYAQRKYQVVFLGSHGSDKDYEEQLSHLAKPLQDILMEVESVVIKGSEVPLETLLRQALLQQIPDMDDTEFRNVLGELILFDAEIRLKKRDRLITFLAQEGIEIDVFGSGWDAAKYQWAPNVHIHDSVTYEEAHEIMSDSKIVLNVLPLFRNGSHERVFDAMLCRAVCISERNIYLSQAFKENEEILFYSFGQLDALPGIIRNVLANEDFAKKIIQNGYEASANKHLWENRAKQILEVANTYYNKYIENTKNHFDTWMDYHKDCNKECNKEDEEYYALLSYVWAKEDKQLTMKAVSTFEQCNLKYPEYYDQLMQYMMERNCGEETDRHGEKFFGQQIHLLKTNINNLKWLYDHCADEISKNVLLKALQSILNPQPLEMSDQEAQGIQRNDLSDRRSVKGIKGLLGMCNQLELESAQGLVYIRYRGDGNTLEGLVSVLFF
jgi:glycosyltransferase involved in cell wall biosynthesis